MSFIDPIPSIPYHFTSQLSDGSFRRQYLDAAGKYAQTASDVFVAVVFLYFTLISRKSSEASKHAVSSERTSSKTLPAIPTNDRINTKFLTRQKETKSSVVMTSIWSAVVAFLVLWRTGDDYLHITRSPAQVASALLGVSIVFSLPFLRSYTPQLISFHRLQSVLIFGLVALHAVLYLNFYVQAGVLTKRIKDIDVQLGVLLTALSIGLWITGANMQVIKSRLGVGAGRSIHVALTTAFGVALWLHVSHSHANLRRAGLVWAIGQAWRIWTALGAVLGAEKRAEHGRKGRRPSVIYR